AHGVDDHAVADDRAQVRVQYAGGQQGKLVGAVAADDGVAGVGAAVVADDQVVGRGEEIDDFPFGLVAPLQADYAGAGHAILPGPERPRWGLAASAPA